MAYMQQKFCTQCQETKQFIVSAGQHYSVCAQCESENRAEERAKHFAALDELTLEERIRKVEEWIYDYRPQYVPEPRF